MKPSTRRFAFLPLLFATLALAPSAFADYESWYYQCKPYYEKECVKYSGRESDSPVRYCIEERSVQKGQYWTYIGKAPGRGVDEVYPVSWSELSTRLNGHKYAYSKSRNCDENTSSGERLRYDHWVAPVGNERVYE